MSHIHEKVDFTASVYIVFKNKVLLHRHRKYPLWLPPGGHIELHEDPNQAALREVKEESGLDIELIGNPIVKGPPSARRRDLIPPKFMNRHFTDETKKHEHVDLIYFGRAQTDVVKPEGNEEFRWLTEDEVEKNDIGMTPDIQAYALAAFRELTE